MHKKNVSSETPFQPPTLAWMMGGLFVTAVLASLAWHWWQHGGADARRAATATATAASAPGTSVAAAGSAAPTQATGPAAAPQNGTTAVDAPIPTGPLPVSDEQRALLRTAAEPGDVEARIAAVNNLRDSYSIEIIDELGQILVTDPAPQVRIQAIESLRIIASNDINADGRIRALLMSAANDGNRDVAHAAKAAIREIEVARGER